MTFLKRWKLKAIASLVVISVAGSGFVTFGSRTATQLYTEAGSQSGKSMYKVTKAPTSATQGSVKAVLSVSTSPSNGTTQAAAPTALTPDPIQPAAVVVPAVTPSPPVSSPTPIDPPVVTDPPATPPSFCGNCGQLSPTAPKGSMCPMSQFQSTSMSVQVCSQYSLN